MKVEVAYGFCGRKATLNQPIEPLWLTGFVRVVYTKEVWGRLDQ